MSARSIFAGILFGIFGVVAGAQTPVLSSVVAPYPALQSSVRVAGGTYGSGAVNYGPAGTPLQLYGSSFGSSGTVIFQGYANGAPVGSPVQASVSLWSGTTLFLTVPSGATTGLMKVIAGGRTSNGLPFMVTQGVYSSSCPSSHPSSQLEITTSSLPDGAVSMAYSTTLAALGGSSSYLWSLSGGTLPAGLSLNTSTGVISGTPTSATSFPVNLSVTVIDNNTHQSANATLGIFVGSQTLTPGVIYSYSSYHDGVGNVTQHVDSVMGTWNFTYDTLNRLQSALPRDNAPSGYAQNNLCMAYDAFGNRTAQILQSSACPAQESGVQPTASYNTSNRVTWTTMNSAVNGFIYDTAGNVTNDNVNTYLYDADGRICAVSTPFGGLTGYLYDAEGRRVAKGTITGWSCDSSVNGFRLTESYVRGQGGEELTVMDGNNQWQRTNVYGAGRLLATYDQQGIHFHVNDPLGTRRVQTDSNGVAEINFLSLPFGEELASVSPPGAAPTAADSTALHFTGKEHDNESGNDYFGARYYASSIGRMLSPDPSGLLFADPLNPQSFNFYAYVRNNPLYFTDPTGLYCAWEDGTSDDDPVDGGATRKQCNKQGGHWTGGNNPCHGMDNCTASFDWNNPQRDKTPTFDPRLDPQLVGVVGAVPTPLTVSLKIDPDSQKILLLARGIKKSTDCAVDSLLKNASTVALDAVGMVPFGGDAEMVALVAVGAVASVTSAVQGDTTGSALSTVDMVQGAAVKAVTSPAIGINVPKVIPVMGQGYSAILVGRGILNASGEYANCF